MPAEAGVPSRCAITPVGGWCGYRGMRRPGVQGTPAASAWASRPASWVSTRLTSSAFAGAELVPHDLDLAAVGVRGVGHRPEGADHPLDAPADAREGRFVAGADRVVPNETDPELEEALPDRRRLGAKFFARPGFVNRFGERFHPLDGRLQGRHRAEDLPLERRDLLLEGVARGSVSSSGTPARASTFGVKDCGSPRRVVPFPSRRTSSAV